MTYIALLRGINVGGHAKVEMARLKQLFITLGCTDVMTYINSGNVIFSDGRTTKELSLLIEAAIFAKFGLAVPVVIRSQENVHELCRLIPSDWANDSHQKSDVYFLLPNVEGSEILASLNIDSEIDTVLLCDGALLWHVSREQAGNSQAHNFIKTKLYRSVTIRNVNTVRKLDSLMQNNQ